MKSKILVVDDEVNICELLSLELELEGYECAQAHTGTEALAMYESFKPDLMLLDLMLPEISGIEVCRQVVGNSDCYVIMLTAKSEIGDKINGLDSGADDYVTKPFDTNELLARIKALLRRDAQNKRRRDPEVYENGELKLYPAEKKVLVGGKLLSLTTTEYSILLLLIKNPTKVFDRETIAAEIGYKDFQLDTRAIDMHIQRLRKKLSAVSEIKYIETVFRIGYRMRSVSDEV